MELTEFLSRASPFCLTEITVNFFSFGFFHVPGDHLSGKLGNVREFDSCQEIALMPEFAAIGCHFYNSGLIATKFGAQRECLGHF